MADSRPERRFTRIDRLPPYVFNITAELKMAARRRGEDIIDFSMEIGRASCRERVCQYV